MPTMWKADRVALLAKILAGKAPYPGAFDHLMTDSENVGDYAAIKALHAYAARQTVLGAGMSPAAKARDVEQSDREYIAQRQARARARLAEDTQAEADMALAFRGNPGAARRLSEPRDDLVARGEE